MVIKYNKEGKAQWVKVIGSNHTSNSIQIVSTTSDGGYIVGGSFEETIKIEGKEITSKGDSDNIIIKYNENGTIGWIKTIGGIKYDYITSLTERVNEGIVVGGYFNSDTIEVDGHTLENQGGDDGMILEIENKVGVPEVQELVVENSRKEFKITTDVNEIDGIKGGSISGENMNPYETVKYGENSTKEIVMTPEEGYEKY